MISSETNYFQRMPAVSPHCERGVEPGSDLGSDPDHLSARAFTGDWDYVKLFNHHVETFFDLDHLELPRKKAKRLDASKVTTTAAYYPPKLRKREKEDDDMLRQFEVSVPGTLWMPHEKEVFFRCLARYSVHQMELFLVHLPAKTTLEIMTYYELLKDQLRQVRRTKRTKVVFRDEDRTHSGGTEDRTHSEVPHTYVHQVFKGARYSKLPIAQEVTEEWVEYEEKQSTLISVREQKLDSDRFRKLTRILRQYTEEQEESPGASLMNYNNARALSRMYRANQITPILEGKPAPRLLFGSLVLLEELARGVTRELMGRVIVRKGLDAERSEVEDVLEADGRKNRKLNVTRNDVWVLADSLKLFETPQAGYSSRNRDGKAPVLDLYWQNILESLGLDIAVDTEKGPIVQMYEKQKSCYASPDGFLSALNKSQAMEYPPHNVDFSARGDYEERTDVEEESESESEKIPLVSELPVDLAGPTERSLKDVLVEEMLTVQETERLEELDGTVELENSEQDSEFSAMWGNTDIGRLCPPELSRDWDCSFATY